jgi:hypothetical protein
LGVGVLRCRCGSGFLNGLPSFLGPVIPDFMPRTKGAERAQACRHRRRKIAVTVGNLKQFRRAKLFGRRR